jgi:transposase
MSWIHKFKTESIEGIRIKSGRGRKRKIGTEKEDGIKSMIQSNPNLSIDELRLKIIEKYGITPSRSTTYRLMKKLHFSYITPRPRHYKAKKSQQEDLKKKSAGEGGERPQ